MKVLVTGATSLIGRHVVRLLTERGDAVRVYQRNPSGLDADERLGDIENREAIEHASTDCDGVIHLAARVGITGSWEQFHRTNVHGTRNVVAAAASRSVERVVHVSSPAVAHSGTSIVGGRAEPALPDRVRGHYARTKAIAEIEALGAATSTMSVIAIRPHLVWGPGDTQLVGRIVSRARSGRLAIVGSGTALIDTTYVDNAAEAIVAALDAAPARSGQAYVVSNGEPRTVQEILTRLLAAHGMGPPSVSVPEPLAGAAGSIAERAWAALAPESEPPITRFLVEQLSTAHWFDQRQTREALSWEPRVSLDEGFQRLRRHADESR